MPKKIKLAIAAASAVLMLVIPSLAGEINVYDEDGSDGYSGDRLIAVNVNGDISASSESAGTITEPTEESIAESENTAGVAGIYDIISDGDGTRYILEPQLDESYEDYAEQDQSQSVSESVTYSVGTTRTVYSGITSYKTNNYFTVEVELRYIGQYCTVWVAQEDTGWFTDEMAKQAGDHFDEKYPYLLDYFGGFLDKDGDGKLAIYFYDIAQDGDYTDTLSSFSYTAGYFWSADLNRQSFELDNVVIVNNNKDCIHIDTRPTIKCESYVTKPKIDIERCYGTLMHEYQHLCNYSCRPEGTSEGTAMNEAFSEAADILIEGDSTRFSHYNKLSASAQAQSFTIWDGQLYNYDLAALFSQYLITQYGPTIFREVLAMRTKTSDTLTLIAQKMNVSVSQLILNFRMALILNEASGSYGFIGTVPGLSTKSLTGSVTLEPGGACVRSITDGSTVSGEGENISLIGIKIQKTPPTAAEIASAITAMLNGDSDMSLLDLINMVLSNKLGVVYDPT